MPRLNVFTYCKSLSLGVEAPGNSHRSSLAAYYMGVSIPALSKIDLSNLKQNREAVEIIPSMLQPPFYARCKLSSGNDGNLLSRDLSRLHKKLKTTLH